MYFERVFTSGALHDVRSKKFAEYKCSVCGCVDCVDITFTEAKHDFQALRSCKRCGQMDSDDMKNQIKSEIDELIKTINIYERKRIELGKQLIELDKLK